MRSIFLTQWILHSRLIWSFVGVYFFTNCLHRPLLNIVYKRTINLFLNRYILTLFIYEMENIFIQHLTSNFIQIAFQCARNASNLLSCTVYMDMCFDQENSNIMNYAFQMCFVFVVSLPIVKSHPFFERVVYTFWYAGLVIAAHMLFVCVFFISLLFCVVWAFVLRWCCLHLISSIFFHSYSQCSALMPTIMRRFDCHYRHIQYNRSLVFVWVNLCVLQWSFCFLCTKTNKNTKTDHKSQITCSSSH